MRVQVLGPSVALVLLVAGASVSAFSFKSLLPIPDKVIPDALKLPNAGKAFPSAFKFPPAPKFPDPFQSRSGDEDSDEDDKSGGGGGLISSIVEGAKNVTSKVVDAVTPDVNGTTFNTFKALLTTVDSCMGGLKGKGWSDPELGNFSVGPESPYCNSACDRNIFCCAPQKPEDLTVNFFFSGKRGQHHELRLNDGESQRLIKQNPKLVWIVHGLGNDITTADPIFNQTRDAFLKRGTAVVLVDWHKGNRLYNQAMANVRLVGALTGQMMLRLGVDGNSVCIGFSLGSHVCGEAGSWIKRHGRKIPRCIGIDPAGPGYDGCTNSIRLDKGDCGVVTSLHTSQYKGLTSILTEEGLGTKQKTGHCDFWANKGKEQPTCDNTTIASFTGLLATGQFGKIGSDLSYSVACSHSRGMQYFLSEVSRVCQFKGMAADCGGGSACTRASDIDAEDEYGNQLLTGMRLPPDDECTSRYNADFTFDTTGKEPFC